MANPTIDPAHAHALRAESRVRAPATQMLRAYVALTKPRIIELLLVTTIPSMIVAARGLPPLSLIGATLVGGVLAAAGANVVNCFLDRDIDARMERTKRRPLPAGTISPRAALVFGIVLEIAAFVWFAATVNLVSAVLGACAFVFYVVVYTIALKRKSTQNIVIGGVAGAIPVLIGWTSVTGTIPLEAWLLFLVVFFWTPPHFWALAIRYRDDYAAAGVPMLPVRVGVAATARQILIYSVLTVAATIAFGFEAGLGSVYWISASLLGFTLLGLCVQLVRRPSERRAMALFHASIAYLGLVFVAIALDQLLRS